MNCPTGIPILLKSATIQRIPTIQLNCCPKTQNQLQFHEVVRSSNCLYQVTLDKNNYVTIPMKKMTIILIGTTLNLTYSKVKIQIV